LVEKVETCKIWDLACSRRAATEIYSYIQSGQKKDTQFYFWDDFIHSAPILTIFSLLQAEFMARKLKFFHPPHLLVTVKEWLKIGAELTKLSPK